jgi:hypothetical protein
MITSDFSLPSLNTSCVKVENKRNTPTKMTSMKVEQDWIPNHRCDVKVKVEEDNNVAVESRFPGANANLADLPTGAEHLKLGKHQMAKRQFNSKINLVSDWLLEHRPKELSNKRHKRHKKYPHICVPRRPTVNTSGKAGAQIPQLPLGDNSTPWGR